VTKGLFNLADMHQSSVRANNIECVEDEPGELTMSVNEIKVWDPFVRIFHWVLVLSFFIAYFTDDEVMWLHEFAGYSILVLVFLRVIWGVIGTKYARFSNFIYKQDIIKQCLSDSLKFKAKRYIGHNPLGGVMVVVLLIMLVLTSWSGIEAEGTGFLAVNNTNMQIIKTASADDDDEHEGGSEFWEEIHEFFAQFTLLLVILHVTGVIISSLSHGENLICAMVTGRKRE